MELKQQVELGDNAFWAVIWTLASIAGIGLLYICLSFSNKEDTLIASSADPIATACALGTRSTVSNQCTAFLARGK